MKPWLPKPRPVPKKTDRLTFDFETGLIAPAIQAPPIAAFGFRLKSDARTTIVMPSDPAFRRLLLAALEDRGLVMAGAHVRFDMACLLAYEPEWAELIFQKFDDNGVQCSLIRDSLIRIAKADPHPRMARYPYNLAAAYKLYCPNGKLVVDKQDEWRLRWYTLAHLPFSQVKKVASQALDYLATDVEATEDVLVAQETQHADWLFDQYNQTSASFALYLTQCWGITTDPNAVAILHEATKKALDDAAALCEARGLVVDGQRKIAAASAAQEAAYARLGLLAPRGEVTEKAKEKKYTVTVKQLEQAGVDPFEAEERAKHEVETMLGNVKLDEEACEASRDPLMVAYSKCSQAGLLLGKVERLKPWKDLPCGLIQASYTTCINSGRTSCTQGKDPKKGEGWRARGSQMQNPPREPGVRECFVSRPGYLLVSIDYDAFELRTWAQCCRWMIGYSKLGEILNDPKRCPHVEMGAAIHRMHPGDAYALKKTDKDLFKKLRQVAKAANFGLPGGMGVERFIESAAADPYRVQLGDTHEEALEEGRRIVKTWKTIYPEAQPYLDLIGKLVGERGSRTRIVQHYSARVRGGVGYCDAANTFFQGLAADAAKRAMWLVCREMYARRSSPLYGSRIVAFIHDELICEIPMAKLEEACKRLQELWTGGAQEVIPDVLITAAPAAAFRWSKAAGDPCFGSDGRLIPYEMTEGYKGMAPPDGQIERWLKIRG